MIGQSRGRKPSARDRRSRPQLEGLESRLLLYATMGAAWTYGNRITFSLVPDGTSIGGTPSTLFQSLTAVIPNMSDWQNQFLKAAAVWQQVANVNLVWVSDNGLPLGVSGNQQGDSRFGDIRISAIPLADGTLGAAFSPPPINGGTAAGDIVINSTVLWRINSSFDLETVAIHEFGHALGMNHSQISNAVMYAYYNGIKQNLTNDDTSGIQSVYGARQYDAYNINSNNNAYYFWAASLDSSMGSNGQFTLSNLNLTTYGQTEWFWVTAPPTNTGNLTVVAQAGGLSLLSPKLTVYDSSLNMLGQFVSQGFGGTAWLANLPAVTGRGYFIQVSGNAANTTTGSYALQVNFGSQALGAVPIPYSTVAQRADVGGGLSSMKSSAGSQELVVLGGIVGRGDALTLPGYGTDHGHAQGGSVLSIPPPFAWMRFMVGPTSDPALPVVPSYPAVLVTVARVARKSVFHPIRAINRATINWDLEAAPATTLSGRMRSRSGSRT
ncbi:matrixin family metalloprotease [Paludisphaera borealis]|uniref:Karilysin n=1 Tax=Paludisphaera borealis TaxID=1387353 RepID=A0A1U7CPS4_9BACT|nr:matrixin family metalloprotease [Paludisphaera borealis]APW60921.1 Karilysin [Paludisphaera borealis]